MLFTDDHRTALRSHLTNWHASILRDKLPSHPPELGHTREASIRLMEFVITEVINWVDLTLADFLLRLEYQLKPFMIAEHVSLHIQSAASPRGSMEIPDLPVRPKEVRDQCLVWMGLAFYGHPDIPDDLAPGFSEVCDAPIPVKKFRRISAIFGKGNLQFVDDVSYESNDPDSDNLRISDALRSSVVLPKPRYHVTRWWAGTIKEVLPLSFYSSSAAKKLHDKPKATSKTSTRSPKLVAGELYPKFGGYYVGQFGEEADGGCHHLFLMSRCCASPSVQSLFPRKSLFPRLRLEGIDAALEDATGVNVDRYYAMTDFLRGKSSPAVAYVDSDPDFADCYLPGLHDIQALGRMLRELEDDSSLYSLLESQLGENFMEIQFLTSQLTISSKGAINFLTTDLSGTEKRARNPVRPVLYFRRVPIL